MSLLMFPSMLAKNSSASSGFSDLYCSNLSFQSFSADCPFSLQSHAFLISLGISNRSCSHPSDSLTLAISSSPRGAPCVSAVPALLGEPNPMTVLQSIKDGLSDAFASVIAFEMASASWPSTPSMTCHPYDLNLVQTSSSNQSSTSPSIEIPLSS